MYKQLAADPIRALLVRDNEYWERSASIMRDRSQHMVRISLWKLTRNATTESPALPTERCIRSCDPACHMGFDSDRRQHA